VHNRKASTAAYVYLSNLVPVSAGSDIIVNKKHHNQNANNVVTNGHSYWKPHGHCNGGQYGRHSLLLSYTKAMTGDTSQACRLHMGLQFLEALVRSHVDKFWKFISWKIGKSIFWSDFLRAVVDELYMRFDFRVGSLCSVKFCTCCCLLPRRAWIWMTIKPSNIYGWWLYKCIHVWWIWHVHWRWFQSNCVKIFFFYKLQFVKYCVVCSIICVILCSNSYWALAYNTPAQHCVVKLLAKNAWSKW